MAKQNKMLVPILLGGGLLAFLMMGKKTSAKTTTSGTGELPEGGGIQVDTGEVPSDEPSGGGGGGTGVKVGAVTALEKQNAVIVINEASLVSNIFPNGFGDKKSGQSDLDWATNMVFWLSYSYPDSYQPTAPNIGFASAYYGGDPVPYKLVSGMKKVDGKGYDYWSKVWLRIRTYLKNQYPEVFK